MKCRYCSKELSISHEFLILNRWCTCSSCQVDYIIARDDEEEDKIWARIYVAHHNHKSYKISVDLNKHKLHIKHMESNETIVWVDYPQDYITKYNVNEKLRTYLVFS